MWEREGGAAQVIRGFWPARAKAHGKLSGTGTIVMAESSEESTCPSRSPTPDIVAGRPRKSPVWQYFVYNDASGKSACRDQWGP